MFEEGSVVYCARGSESVLLEEKFQELVLGLELTGTSIIHMYHDKVLSKSHFMFTCVC